MPMITFIASTAAFILGYFLAAILAEWKRQDLEMELVDEIRRLERRLEDDR